jgi:biopolymer transport protein ExbB
MTGFIMMIVIGLMFAIAVYIFIERYLTINKAIREDKNFMTNIRDLISNDKLDSALSLCRNNESPSARMIEKGLKRIGKPLSDINVVIENEGNLEVARLEKNIAGLATIAGAAPMLGFLGTITGLVMAFNDLSMSGTNIDIVFLSNKIYQALITTVAGLVVGILAYVFYNILVSRVEKLVFILESRASEFMDMLNEPTQ